MDIGQMDIGQGQQAERERNTDCNLLTWFIDEEGNLKNLR